MFLFVSCVICSMCCLSVLCDLLLFVSVCLLLFCVLAVFECCLGSVYFYKIYLNFVLGSFFACVLCSYCLIWCCLLVKVIVCSWFCAFVLALCVLFGTLF